MKRTMSSGRRSVSVISRRCRTTQKEHLRLQPFGAGTTNVRSRPSADDGSKSGRGHKAPYRIFAPQFAIKIRLIKITTLFRKDNVRNFKRHHLIEIKCDEFEIM